jgi:NADPH2:quinone reductase
VSALEATGATLAFDATGGGTLADQILAGMERALLSAPTTDPSPYGSTRRKQVYLYGGLASGPTLLDRNYGAAWGVGGWLLFNFLDSVGSETVNKLRARVAAEITSTFASTYTQEVSLAKLLTPETLNRLGDHSTGAKLLLTPQAVP